MEDFGRLRSAAEETTWLVERGYPADAVAGFVAAHRQLDDRERLLLACDARCNAHVKHHIARELDPEDVARRPLRVDAESVLALIDAARRGALLLESPAGVVCDPEWRRGSFAPADLAPLFAPIGEVLRPLRPGATQWLLDEASPLGEPLAAALGAWAKSARLKAELQRVPDTVRALANAGFVVSADPSVLDAAGTWFNLAALAVRTLPQAALARLHA